VAGKYSNSILLFAFVAHLVGGDNFQFVKSAALDFAHRHRIGLDHRTAVFRPGASLRAPGDAQFFAVEEDFDVFDARAPGFRFGFRIAFVRLVGGFDFEVVDGEVELGGFIPFPFFFCFLKGLVNSPSSFNSGFCRSTLVVKAKLAETCELTSGPNGS
jgi:hypothetical protein